VVLETSGLVKPRRELQLDERPRAIDTDFRKMSVRRTRIVQNTVLVVYRVHYGPALTLNTWVSSHAQEYFLKGSFDFHFTEGYSSERTKKIVINFVTHDEAPSRIFDSD
jgi:hypothetical protein